MALSEVVNFVSNIPFWGWIIVFFIFIILTGDRILWDYEVKFPMEAGIGRGKVELECLAKKGTRIALKFELDPAYQQKQIEILRNGLSIYRIEASLNTGKSVFIKQITKLEKPDKMPLLFIVRPI